MRSDGEHVRKEFEPRGKLPFQAVLFDAALPAYRSIALEARHLRSLGLTLCAIAHHLGVTDKTVAKAFVITSAALDDVGRRRELELSQRWVRFVTSAAAGGAHDFSVCRGPEKSSGALDQRFLKLSLVHRGTQCPIEG